MMTVIAAVLALGVGLAGGFLARKALVSRRMTTAESRAAKLMADAEMEAETKVRTSLDEVRQEISAMRKEAEQDIRLRRQEIKGLEDRLTRREASAEAKLAELQAKEQKLEQAAGAAEELREELARTVGEERRELERVSRLTTQEAKEALIAQVVDVAKRDAMATVREIEQRAREEGEKRARKIVTIAIQRVASDQTAESTVSVFPLPSDDMKGRIIGREGRNIRAFEALTGVNLIIDDTPEAVVLSCFDPVRREVARLTLEKLVSDGRIQPARIEEM
jgi:ribonuclease Y